MRSSRRSTPLRVAGGIAALICLGCSPVPAPAPLLASSPVPAGSRACGHYRTVDVDTTVDATGRTKLLRPTRNQAPKYPPDRRQVLQEGRVLMNFIVGSTGGVLPHSLLIVYESHPDFGNAVCAVLPRFRFAAEAGSRLPGHTRVVGMPFLFHLSTGGME